MFRWVEMGQDFRKTLMLLEIDETDLICLFDLMDVDRSGDLTYEASRC